MLKRTICMLLVLVSILGILPVTGFAEELVFYDRAPSRARTIETQEAESNDSRGKAQFLTQDDNIVSGTVHCYDDPNDYFYINISQSCYFKMVCISGAGGEKSTKFRLYNSSGTLLKTASYDGEENTDDYFSLEYELSAGKYYIRVSDSENYVAYQFYFQLEPQLDAPKVTSASNVKTGKPVIKWKAVSGAASYGVYRSNSKNGTYTNIATVVGTSYTDTSARVGKTYYYKVKAISADTSVALDSKLSTAMSHVCDLPRPSGVKVTQSASSGKNVIKWNKVSGADKYEVFYATSKTGTYKSLGTTEKTTWTHKSAKVNTTYYYKVKAIYEDNKSANSAFSAVRSGRCDCARPTVTLTLASSGAPKLSWKTVDGAVSYKVYRSRDGEDWSLLKKVTGTSLKDTGAKAGVKYYYRVMAIAKNSEANSAYSQVKSITAK